MTRSRPQPSDSCVLCGATEAEELFAAGVAQEGRIVRCRSCGLMFVSPQGRVELNDYREAGGADSPSWELSPSSLERQRNQVRDYRDALEECLARAPGGGRVLEIGCCTGALLHELQTRGLSCLGLEPNGWAADYGRRTYGLEIRATTLDAAELADASFDCVLLLHVIEHVTDPVALLRKIRRILKPGGFLVLETPRYDTFMFKLMGRRERNLVDNWHLYFFTTATLARMLTTCGFRIDGDRKPGRTVTPSRLVGSFGKAFRLRPLEALANRMAQTRLNSWLSFRLNLRDIYRVCAVASGE